MGEVNLFKTIGCDLQREDYIKIYGLTGLLQNFSEIPKTSSISKPFYFGYQPPMNIKQINIQINY